MSVGRNPKYVFHHPPKKVSFCGTKFFLCEWTGTLMKEGWTLQTGPDDFWGIFSSCEELRGALIVLQNKQKDHPLFKALPSESPMVRLHVDSCKSIRSTQKRSHIKDYAFLVQFTTGGYPVVDLLPKINGMDDLIRSDVLAGQEFFYRLYIDKDDSKYHVWCSKNGTLDEDFKALFTKGHMFLDGFVVITANPEGVPGGLAAVKVEEELKQKRRLTGKRKAPESCAATEVSAQVFEPLTLPEAVSVQA